MPNKNLLKDSKAYYSDNDYYEIFSIAEDGEHKVSDYLNEISQKKIVLDAGCGTGKFLNIIESVSKKYIGVDLSLNQLNKAKQKSKNKNSIFINTNLASIPLEDKSVDLVISSWVLGTITNIKERLKCLSELKRVLKTNGKIILIENDINSEFEKIRSRDKDDRTINYNNWILSNGFELDKKINTYFLFNSKEEAQKCLEIIYGKEVASKIKNKTIEHKIITFIYQKLDYK